MCRCDDVRVTLALTAGRKKSSVLRLEEDVDGLDGIAVGWETLHYW
jgi:hypothetical protein